MGSRSRTVSLLHSAEIWASEHGMSLDPDVLGYVLELRATFSNATEPRRWVGGDIEDLLLHVLPRKAISTEAPAEVTPPTLETYLRFLESTGQIAGQSAPLRALLDELDQCRSEYGAALVDPAKAGPAKLVVEQMLSRGLDPADPDALQQWIDEVNSSSYEQRVRLTGGPSPEWANRPPPATSARRLPPLPVVRLADTAYLAAQAQQAPLLRQLVALVKAVTPAAEVTETGMLRPKIVGAVIDRLDLGLREGDRYQLARLRSGWDVVPFARLWVIATEAGWIDVGSRRVVPGETAEHWAEDDQDHLLSHWCDVFDRVVDLGTDGGAGGYGFAVLDEIDAATPVLLLGLYSSRLPLPLTEAYDLFAVTPPDLDPGLTDFPRKLRDGLVDEWLRRLTDTGALVVENEQVVLTPLGVFGVRQRLQAEGADAPAIYDPTALEADELLSVGYSMSLADKDAVIREWLDTRSAADAARQLLDGATKVPPELRPAAFEIVKDLGTVGDAAILAAVDTPLVGPYARSHLFDHGHPDLAPSPDDRQWLLVDLLSGMNRVGDTDDVVRSFESAEDSPANAAQLAESLWRVDHPDVTAVLDVLGSHHPDKVVAKAARKAAFKARSRGSSNNAR